jgi:hypothetical protein
MSTEKSESRYLDSAEAAAYLNVSRSMLAKRRLTGDGPSYSKLGKRVIYALVDLDKWVAELKRRSTSEGSVGTMAG